MAATWDAIVIGGGHNGLVAGAYLAKAGARTVVLEARHKTGGAAATDAPWPEAPEIKVTRLSYVMSPMRRQFNNTLAMEVVTPDHALQHRQQHRDRGALHRASLERAAD